MQQILVPKYKNNVSENKVGGTLLQQKSWLLYSNDATSNIIFIWWVVIALDTVNISITNCDLTRFSYQNCNKKIICLLKNNQWISIHTIGFDDEHRWISNGKDNNDFEQHVYCVNLISVTQSSEKYCSGNVIITLFTSLLVWPYLSKQ